MGIIKEFKDFAMRGNVIDMAVGIVIGGAFGQIISSLVDDIIMPLIGVLIGGIHFSNLQLVLQKANDELGKPEIAIHYGSFIQIVIDFIIIALAIFLVIKSINSLSRKKSASLADNTPLPEPPADIQLLTEIRDLLKK